MDTLAEPVWMEVFIITNVQHGITRSQFYLKNLLTDGFPGK